MRRGLVIALMLPATAAASPVMTGADDPHPGIHHETWADDAAHWQLHLLKIDLSSAEIGVYATKESQRGMTTSAYADALGAQVAVNGAPFTVADFHPYGLAIGGSKQWTDTADTDTTAVFHFTRTGEQTTAAIEPPLTSFVVPPDNPNDVQGAVSGWPLLVRAGQAGQFDCNDAITIQCQPAPRTAVALSADSHYMWLVVADGWQASSYGMTAAQLAQFLVSQHVDRAMALDSGSSSTLFMDDGVVNHPSDGVERPVANHIAIKYGQLPHGSVAGRVCKHDYIACRTDTSLYIPGATVILDDGRTIQDIGADAFFEFTNVTPRIVCVTAKKTGYRSATRCVLNDLNDQPCYASVALEPGDDPPDAGVPDAPDGVDAQQGGGDSVGPDGGNHEMGPGPNGCCDAGRAPPPIALIGVVWLVLRRRR